MFFFILKVKTIWSFTIAKKEFSTSRIMGTAYSSTLRRLTREVMKLDIRKGCSKQKKIVKTIKTMKIYDISQIPEGLRPKTYEDYLISGYTAGYEAGYNAVPCYRKMYFTIEALEPGNFYVRKSGIEYSVNGGNWITTTGETEIHLQISDVIRFKAKYNNNQKALSGNTIAFKAYGNAASIDWGDNFHGQKTIRTGSSLKQLFYNSTGLVDAENLVLPATALTYGCYVGMFYGCSNLVTVPELPATTLSEECYRSMFSGCENLTYAPVLPATTLEPGCYALMFYGCTGLTQAPELPAQVLIDGEEGGCYEGMFSLCSSLNYIKCLATTNLPESGDFGTGLCNNWLFLASDIGTFVKAPGVVWPTGVSGIPEGWTVIDA